jgi:undecaprenyl-diphosphatase
MLEHILSYPEQLDQQLFLFLNSANSPFWDRIMVFLSRIPVWIPLYLAILVYLGFRYKRKFYFILLFIIIAITLSDQLSVLVKNSVDRLRPCHEPALQGLVHVVNGACGGIYGFVSSHAANTFNVALLSLLLIRKKWYSVFIIIWASAVSYSRIYLGVHYPADVMFGAILGALTGWGIYGCYMIVDERWLLKNSSPTPRRE